MAEKFRNQNQLGMMKVARARTADIIRVNLMYLCDKTTNPFRLSLSLVSTSTISVEDQQVIMAKLTDLERFAYLYQLVAKKGPGSFQILMEALNKTGNEHIYCFLKQKLASSESDDEEISLNSDSDHSTAIELVRSPISQVDHNDKPTQNDLNKRTDVIYASNEEEVEHTTNLLLQQECHSDLRFLRVILTPILSILCYKTTDHDTFAFELRCSEIITPNQQEECNEITTSLQKSQFLYNIIMKKPISYNNVKNLFQSLKVSGNTNMIHQIIQSYKADQKARGEFFNSGYTSDTPLVPSNQNVTVTDSTSSISDSLPSSVEVANEVLVQVLDSNQSDKGQMQPLTKEAITLIQLFGVTLLKYTIIDETIKTKTIHLELHNCQFKVKNLHKYLAQLARTLETLEFDTFTIRSGKLISVKSLISPRQRILFPKLKSLTIKIDLRFILTSKKLLKSLVSVIYWEGSSKSRLNQLWNLSENINIVDISIGGMKFLFFNKAEGHLKVNRLPYFDPNKYLLHFGDKLKHFCCAENSRENNFLCLENINPASLTELNFNKCEFTFPSTGYELELNRFLSKCENLTKIVIDQKYRKTNIDSGNFPSFNLNYIKTASKLEILKLGNFKITVNTEFCNIWNGQTLEFYNCDLDSLILEELKEAKRDISEKSSHNNDNLETFFRIQNNRVFDDANGSRENIENNDEKNDLWVKISSNGNEWNLSYRVYSGTAEERENFEKTYFTVFEQDRFSDFESRHI